MPTNIDKRTWFSINRSALIFCDNKATISNSENSMQHDRTKYVEIDRYFNKENLENKVISLSFGIKRSNCRHFYKGCWIWSLWRSTLQVEYPRSYYSTWRGMLENWISQKENILYFYWTFFYSIGSYLENIMFP